MIRFYAGRRVAVKCGVKNQVKYFYFAERDEYGVLNIISGQTADATDVKFSADRRLRCVFCPTLVTTRV